MSLLLLPLVWLGLKIPFWGTATTALLFNSLTTAATAVGILLVVRRLGYGRKLGISAGLIFGLGTLAWPYAKTCFSDPLAGLCLVTALLFLMRFSTRGSLVDAAIAGAALAIAVATRYANLVLVAPFGLLLIWYAWTRSPSRRQNPPAWRDFIHCRHSLWHPVAAFVSPLLITGLLLIWYNVVRYGAPFNTGYLPQESFSGIWWQGIVGLLVSPGRGLFLYAPILLIALPAIPAALRRYPAEACLSLAVTAIHILLYGKWFMWHGGYAWGPRFIVPAVPFLVLLMPPALSWMRRRIWRFAACALMAASAVLQIIGLSVHFELFQNQLLNTGLPLFAPETFFHPRYSPLLGQLQFVTMNNLDLAWVYQGQIQWTLLAGLLLGLVLTGLFLATIYVNSEYRLSPSAFLVAALVVLSSTVWLLSNVHRQYPADLQAAADTLNSRSTIADAIVTGAPADSIPFAELYQGSADVVGLSAGTLAQDADAMRALQQVVDGYAKIWWLPGWTSTSPSDVQNWLAQHAFLADSLFFPDAAGSSQGRSLSLYYVPRSPLQSHPVEAVFDGQVHLLQADVEHVSLRGGQILPVALHWEAMSPISSNLTVFVQLMDANGNRIAGSDSQPAMGTRPTSGWEPNEIVLDRHALLLPDDLPAGPYTLITGLYFVETGQRLTTAAGQDTVQIASFPVAN